MINKVLEQMTAIVEKSVKHYKTDFYDYDMKDIKDGKSDKYIWIVRDCGTWLSASENISNTYSYYLDDKSVAYYEIDMKRGTVKKIPFGKRERIKTFSVNYYHSQNVFMRREIKLDARNKEAAERMAANYMPEGYEYFVVFA